VESHGAPDDPLLMCDCSPNRRSQSAGDGSSKRHRKCDRCHIHNGSITVALDIGWLLRFGLSGLRSGI
jgi:hypothetical protein